MLYTLVYTSKPVAPFSQPEMDDLLSTSILNNTVNNITGILLYNNKNFIQVIEGEKRMVLQLFDRIKADKRHEFILKMMEGNIPDRQFPTWEMGLRELDKVKIIDDILPPSSKTPVAVLIRKYLAT